jgi:hypothetical protein
VQVVRPHQRRGRYSRRFARSRQGCVRPRVALDDVRRVRFGATPPLTSGCRQYILRAPLGQPDLCLRCLTVCRPLRACRASVQASKTGHAVKAPRHPPDVPEPLPHPRQPQTLDRSSAHDAATGSARRPALERPSRRPACPTATQPARSETAPCRCLRGYRQSQVVASVRSARSRSGCCGWPLGCARACRRHASQGGCGRGRHCPCLYRLLLTC